MEKHRQKMQVVFMSISTFMFIRSGETCSGFTAPDVNMGSLYLPFLDLSRGF